MFMSYAMHGGPQILQFANVKLREKDYLILSLFSLVIVRYWRCK